jgi:hypothetical protein
MRYLFSAFALAMLLASGGAWAQGTESTPGGTSTGTEAGSKPTPQDCARGWSPNSRWSAAEFRSACREE